MGAARVNAYLAVAATFTAATIIATLLGPLPRPWSTLAVVAMALLWVAYIGASVRQTVADEIRLRIDRMQGELIEKQNQDTNKIVTELTRQIDQVNLLKAVVREMSGQAPAGEQPPTRGKKRGNGTDCA